jgi:hypothetical protein
MTDVVLLRDAEGRFATFREAFGLDDDYPWRLPFYCVLARLDDAVVLVDTGPGPPGEEPFFPNARYVAHADDYEWAVQTCADRPYVLTHAGGPSPRPVRTAAPSSSATSAWGASLAGAGSRWTEDRARSCRR